MDENNQNWQNNGQYSNYQDYTANVSYQAPPEDRGKRTNGLQIAALVCGILAICSCWCYGLPSIILGIAGLICAITGNNRGKTGVGIAGLVCSIIGLVLGVASLFYYIWILKYMSDTGLMDEILQNVR